MTDMSAAIIPKSDQLNSDDLITGPITITITSVTIKAGEQPVSMFYEGDNGKPYKPCKSMARILVSAWGADSKQYVGRALTLYRDPTVKWGGMDVGGIRISHMSDLDAPMTMALTATKGSRKPFTVKPLEKASAPALITADQARDLLSLMEAKGIKVKSFLEFGDLDSVEELAASAFEGAKKWIAKQKVAEPDAHA